MKRALLVAPVVFVAWHLAACGAVDDPDPIVQGCAFYAAMDEESWNGTTGEVADSCGGDDNGTARPGVTTVANGTRGRAASFVNRNGCIDVPDSARIRPTDVLTLSAWVMPKALTAQPQEAFGIISKRTRKDVDDSYNLSLWTGNKVWVELQDSGDRMAGNAVLMNDRWTQITMVYDGGRLPGERVRTYIDGLLDLVSSESSPMLSSSAVPLRIGCMPGLDESSGMAVNQGFIGLIDDVVVWKRILGDTEVADWYRRTQP
jgi:MSHA biogenesis protein MshQ